jgi:hypothetical protein
MNSNLKHTSLLVKNTNSGSPFPKLLHQFTEFLATMEMHLFFLAMFIDCQSEPDEKSMCVE